MEGNRKTDKAGLAKPHGSRLTIGLLIGRLGDQRYQAHVWPGVADVAEEQDVNLICFVGGALRAPHEFDAQRNVAYDLASPENVDGLVTMSGSLGQFIGPERLRHFYERYHPLPMVSIAMALNGIPSVLVDNQAGMRDAITHLIEAHGFGRIAFICGPEASPEAEQRYQTYTEVLAEHGLPLDPDLVAPGNFLSPSGEEAIRLLLDERRAGFEAVVSANDEMALGALAALRERGMRVPEDVSVVGFDDIEEARFVAPPLATIRQPLYEQGRRAAEMLLALLAGEDVPEQVTLPTEFVTRRSCGCLSQPASRAAMALATWTGEALEATSAQRERILSEMGEAAGASAAGIDSGWAERLLDAFTATLKDQPRGAFLPTLDEILRQVGAEGGDVMRWHRVLSVLHHHAPPSLADGEDLSSADDLWQQARTLIEEMAQWAQAHRRIQAERRAFEFTTRISEPLMTAFDVAGLTDVVARRMPQMGIRSCYLSLYEQPAEGEREIPTAWSRLILAYDKNGRIGLEPGGRRFPSRQLVPDDILSRDRRYAIVLEPLHFRDENQFGFVVFEPLRPKAGALREALIRQISTALKGALLMQERRRAEEALRDHTERLETLRGIDRAIIRAQSPEEIAHTALRCIRRLVPCLGAAVVTLNSAAHEATILAVDIDGEPGTWETEMRFPLERLGDAAQTFEKLGRGEFCVTEEDLSHPWVPREIQNLGAKGMRAVLSAPLVFQETLIGLLVLGVEKAKALNNEHIEIVREVADQLAVAIQNARLLEAEHRRSVELEALHQASLHLTSSLEQQPVLEAIIEHALKLASADSAHIFLYDGKLLTFGAAAWASGLQREPHAAPRPEGLTYTVARTGEPIVIPDVDAAPLFQDRQWGGAVAGLPLHSGGEVCGVMNIAFEKPHAFGENELNVLGLLADQAAIAIQNARLHQQVRQHADELAEALTRQKELDHLKDEFIQNVSHELRSPLALIRSYAELLADGELGELQSEQQKPLSTIVRRSRMLSDLVEDITLILEAETRPLERVPVLLDEVARAATEDFCVPADQAGLRLRVEIAPGLPPVSSSLIYLRRVLDNLLSNAIKFTPPGGTVTVRAWQEGRQVVLQVRDTGIGIPPDQLERIFERFYQVDGSIRRRYGGVGLGLALVKEIVDLHGGHVTVESQVGEGSAFTVTLPICER
jgi:signal transduction histidine kinase/DNA-binding LacI/PurR family transcriptional regulator